MAQENKYLYQLFNHWFRGGNIYVYSDAHFQDLTMYGVRYKLALSRKVNGEVLSEFENELIELYEDKDILTNKILLDKLDLAQVKSINKGLGKNDTIIFLGDMIEKDHIEEGLKYCSMIKGYKVLVKGNHDAGDSRYVRKIEECTRMPRCPKCGSTDVSPFYEFEYLYGYCNKCNYFQNVTSWEKYQVDNHLFDEVYPGVLTISEKVILSHQPFKHEAMFNIHGHVHESKNDTDHLLNVAAEWIGYKPISLLNLYKSGAFKSVDSIHRQTIDKATERKRKKLKIV